MGILSEYFECYQSAENVSLGGTMTTTTTQITTDFALEQDLSFITKGLSARAMVSLGIILL